MTIWIVMYDNEIMGAFRSKEDAYNCIVKDFTESNAPIESTPYYQSDKEWFDEELANLKEEYENYSSFGCCDKWYASETQLN